MLNSQCLISVLLLSSSACTSNAKSSGEGSQEVLYQLSAISLGDSKSTVVAKLGPPKVKSTEKFNAIVYETWSYSRADGSPIGSISLDPESGLVARRLVWVSEKQPEEDFVYLKSRTFPTAEFEEFNTCDKHWDTKFKMDRKQGVLVGVRRQKVFLVAWSDLRLTKLQAEQLSVKCPERPTRF
jgi:hypothetical protein